MSQGIAPGLTLGDERYRIIRQLGHGAFGRTYVAQDLNRFNELCVLKEFAPEVQGTYALQKAEELFEREAGVLYKLKHPQIPRFRELLRVKQPEKRLLLVQDFIEGNTYHSLLAQRKLQGVRFNETEVTQLLLNILPVLRYIHLKGVIHRDISPDNLILRSTDGLPVLIDFGGVKQVAVNVVSQFSAAALNGSISRSATRLGKVGYAPQEQMLKGIVSPSSDLHALAATVLVLLTGKEPQELIDAHNFSWNWRQEVDISPNLGSILDKMLHLIPRDRYQSANQVLQALAGSSTPEVEPPEPQAQPQPESTTQATVAVAPAPDAAKVAQSSSPMAQTQIPSSTSSGSLGCLGTTLLGLAGVFAVGSLSFFATTWWLQYQTPPEEQIEPSSTDEPPVFQLPDQPTVPPQAQFSQEEQERKRVLRGQRRRLGINDRFYVALVNQAFWNQYPNQQGRQLTNQPEDEQLREQWDEIAAQELEKLEQVDLSLAARRRLGNYGEADINRWKREVNQLHLSSRALYDLADAKFLALFPEQRDQEFLKKPIGQVWRAIAADQLKDLKSGDTLEEIVFDPGAFSKEISGTLQPGEGKAFIARLRVGQEMDVSLETDPKVLFSIYGPTRQIILLEDSRDRSWLGELTQSGFYEFVVTSDAQRPIDYTLELRVEGKVSPEFSAEEEE
ncbi:MAG: serine/threonine protein kinase [Symploca sp. SIO1C4]|uniref:non-specific serine/threonine protein kinase n=1 Tax=Symploca sp. SIO1C4 TaxID=2607765 RepID=A0A6B3NCS2_9CYAN|nr:serine/threonine protein kinase [Symploca sp. SIO1C4]